MKTTIGVSTAHYEAQDHSGVKVSVDIDVILPKKEEYDKVVGIKKMIVTFRGEEFEIKDPVFGRDIKKTFDYPDPEDPAAVEKVSIEIIWKSRPYHEIARINIRENPPHGIGFYPGKPAKA